MTVKSKKDTRKIGDTYEKLVCNHLENCGYSILCKNYRCHFGEIDIIAKDKEYIVFIEVKYRKNAALGYPGEAVTLRKQRKIIQSSLFFIHQNHISLNSNFRYDVVCILNDKINIIKNAF